ncbi:Sec23-binding domain of Sec16-domain-containing protein [Aspergillus unguis]
METHSEPSPVWNPALRSDEPAPAPEHEVPVATTITNAEEATDSEQPSLSAPQPEEPVVDATDLPSGEPTAPVDSEQVLPTEDAVPDAKDVPHVEPIAPVESEEVLPTSEEPAPDANSSTHTEPSAPIETQEAPATDEHLSQAETREEFHEEAAELFSAAGGESEEPNPFESENAAGDGEVQPSQETNVPEVQATQTTSNYPSSANGEIGETNHDLWGSPKSVDNGEDHFFDQLKTQTKPIYFPEAESRYEEGLPLLDDVLETPIEPTAPQPSQIDTVFEGDENEDDGFFNSTQKPEGVSEPEGPFHIHRKSTSQVMDDSLGSDQGAVASPLSPTAEEFDNILAAAASNSPEKVKEAASEEDLAAAWQAELSDDDLEVAPAEEDLAAKWQAELDDDDLLLEDVDDVNDMANGDVGDNASQTLGSPFGTPQTAARPKPSQSASAYAPHQPSTADLVGVPAPGAPLGTSAPYSASYLPSRPKPAAPVVRAESFAEQSKQGYKSPYDLPEDLAPRRRPAARPVIGPAVGLPTPPRSSSIPAPPPPQASSAVPTPPVGAPPAAPTAAASAPPPVPTPKNFYEELPLPPVRPRSRPASSGRYAPNPAATSPTLTQPPPPAQPTQPNVISQPNPYADIPSQPSLEQPERSGPYANTLAPSSQSAPVVPSVNSRYSPKPPTLQPGAKPPAASARYSPAPPPSAAPPPPQRYASQPIGIPGQGAPLPFQPRTSSPLAYHEKVSYQPNDIPRKASLPQPTPPIDIQPPSVDAGAPVSPRSLHLQPTAGPVAGEATSAPSAYQPSSPPRNPYAPPSYIEEFSRRVNHANNAPSPYAPPPESSPFVPPRRSQTQSPTQQQAAPRLSVPTVDPLKRPASVHGPSSPTKTANAYAPAQSSSHTRAISQSLEFIPPSDGQENDPLQRWKGAPIFKFGFGGTVLSSFPKHIPRYSAGQTAPKLKPMPGDIKTAPLNDVMPFPGSIVQHPGPLRNKSSKKDLIAWLSSKIAAFENEGVSPSLQAVPDSHKRHEEKVLLWKVVRVLVEHDSGAQTSPELQKALRSVIFPHLQTDASDNAYGGSLQSFAAQPLGGSSQSDATDSKPLDSIRDSLLLGEREKAVWSAADNRLWGHAMIIASTLDKSIWKQVVQEFVRREVRSSSGNAESLAALYEIFAGNFEESIDELVPPSARAGLQMVSKVDGQGSSKDALAGLESWKDTLGLVLSNRSPDDHQALLALGRLLLSYGRVEAAHICLVFSRAAVFGGPDDRQANIALLGVDHIHSSPSALLDDDAILLTEAYEYATSVLAGSPTSTLPHLLAFKLVHAWSLTDQGHKSQAQSYCDAIAAALKSTTKPTAYHHQHLFFGVDELSARLKQTTGEGGSWISKPSMEKVSSSMWNRFSNFVAGDDSDAASIGSGKGGEGELGPFAKISGTPTVSRSPSVSDLYGQYPMPAAQPIPASGPSRYAPSNQYAPSSSPDQGRGRSSLDSQRSASFGLTYGGRRKSQEYPPQTESPMYAGGPFYSSPSVGYQSTPPQTSYMPLAPVDEDPAQQAQPSPSSASQGFLGHDSPYQPSVNTFDQSFGVENTLNSQQNEANGYMPPTSSFGYEPPSGAGPTVEVTEESDDEKPRKKSVMDDDDDDLAARSEALKKAEKARKDKEADEAFRKAAEADAQKAAPAKSSWWGWIKGGNKEEANAAGKPIKAKLGEESSFYFDKDLKKWVNKKDPNSATPARATPPPPKAMGPPSRTASGSSMPPPPVPMPAGPGSRPPSSGGAPPPPLSSSPATSLGLPPTPALGPARSVSTGAVSAAGDNSSRPGSSAGPPPRPSTSLSHASSIDDLLGAPQARKGATSRGRKKGRYVDVMAQ